MAEIKQPQLNLEEFKQKAIQRGIPESKINLFLQKRGLSAPALSQQPTGPINFFERLKLSFGDEEAKKKLRELETKSGLRGRLDIGDIADVAGAIPSLAGFIAGGALGAAGGPAGSIAGGAAGSAAGEAVRQAIGKALGVQKEFEPGDIALEGIVAGAAGAAGLGISKLGSALVKKLPQRIAKFVVKQPTKEILRGKDVSKFLLEKGRLGSRETLIAKGEEAIKVLENTVKTTLKSKRAEISKDAIIQLVKKSNPQAGLTNKQIDSLVKALAPQAKKLLAKKTLNLTQANTLRKSIDQTLASQFAKQAPPFRTKVLRDFTNSLRKTIQKKSGLEKVFDEWEKEILLNKALKSASAQAGKNQVFSLLDILGIAGGVPFGSPTGGFIARRILSDPASLEAIAVFLNKAGKVGAKAITPTTKTIGRTGLFEALRGIKNQ